MGFLKPKIPTAPAPANPAMSAVDLAGGASPEDIGLAPATGSLIRTSSAGLKRRPETQRTSLIGG